MTQQRITRFLVVTPSFNAPEFLDETVGSVLEQQGDFTIHYHIQDGGSKDRTLDVIRQWAARCTLEDAGPGAGRRVHFSWKSEPDSSMYEAIQRGFDGLLEGTPIGEKDRVIMTWINSDDRFTPNAFHTVATFLADHPEEQWVTGIPCLTREDGCIADLRLEDCGYARARLARGEYDGRRLPPVMQEGTFWTRELWHKAGGLNAGLRLAGDWDLWRRMAQHARLINLRAVLAYHRRRDGQLSADMAKYWAEVDTTLAQSAPGCASLGGVDRIALEGAWMAAWRTNLGKWVVSPMRYRRDGLIHCLSDCLVESWKQYPLGRALIRCYRRVRGVETE